MGVIHAGVKMAQTVFTEWQHSEGLDGILSKCRELIADTDFPTVRRWREAGGKVVGHFQVYFPEEIVHAAGMLPFKVRGASIEPKQAASHFGSYLCSILKTSLELVLSERIELDMFVTQPICDAARNLAAVWGRNFSYPCEILYLPQNATSSYSIQYLRGEYDRFKQGVEEIAGRQITDDDLRNSLAVFNENRALLRDLYAIKRKTPWLISVDEAYVLVAVGGLIPREEHNHLLRTVLPLVKQRAARQQDKIRVVFEGGFCEQPPLDLLRTIGQACYVVDDDLFIGLRWILKDVSLNGKDPLYNLAEAYLESSSYSPVQHDLRKPKEKMLLKRVKESGAEAVIITAPKMCEPALDEQVTYTYALDEEGIAYFVSEFEENMIDFDNLELQLETFIENLLFQEKD
jgi:benzoyl-CoA reductase subunit C